MKFDMGQLVMTSGINDRIADDIEFARFAFNSLRRHANGDWGNLCREDIQENEISLQKGFRILSSYGEKDNSIWIITEADRSVTTILFPSEY